MARRGELGVVCGACLVVIALAMASPARAQDGPPRECAEASASRDPRAREQAFAIYAESRERYAEGDFDAAVALLERAYARFPEPVLLYNLARTLEGMARWRDAADAYECYLERQPDARDRGAIERRVEALRRTDDEVRPPPLPDDRAPDVSSPSPATPSVTAERELAVGPFVLLGLGALSLAGGSIMGGLALATRDDASTRAVHTDAAGTFRTAEHYAIVADVAWAVAGVALIAGLVWGIVDWTAAPDVEVALDLGAGHASLRISLP